VVDQVLGSAFARLLFIRSWQVILELEMFFVISGPSSRGLDEQASEAPTACVLAHVGSQLSFGESICTTSLRPFSMSMSIQLL
jgi:hypothetical protein